MAKKQFIVTLEGSDEDLDLIDKETIHEILENEVPNFFDFAEEVEVTTTEVPQK